MKKTILGIAAAAILATALSACTEDEGTEAEQACRDALQATCESMDRCGFLGLGGYSSVGDCYEQQASKCNNVGWMCEAERQNWPECVDALETMECSRFLIGPPDECDQ